MKAHTGRLARSLPRSLTLAALAVLFASPGPLVAQEQAREEQREQREFPRTELDRELDALATYRAQDLNQAYYEYEQALEEARQEAERLDRPSLFTERRAELRRELERRVLRIERRYEQRRADLLERHTGRRFEGGEPDDRFGNRDADVDAGPPDDAARRRPPRAGEPAAGQPGMGRSEMGRLNAELAETWAEFHERARALRERARTDESWDGYEEAITRLEDEYRDQIADIERRQRQLRFEMERARWRDTTAAPRRGQTTP